MSRTDYDHLAHTVHPEDEAPSISIGVRQRPGYVTWVRVVLDFGGPGERWIDVPPAQARELAAHLLVCAEEADREEEG